MLSLLFVASLLALALGAAPTPSSLYPQPTFIRTLYMNDVFANSFCIENGDFGTAQGVGSQILMGVQPCWVGALRIQTDGTTTSIGVGMIGGVATSVLSMGSINDIVATYNLGTLPLSTVYLSLSVNNQTGNLAIAQPNSAQTILTDLPPAAYASLLTTTTSNSIPATPGQVFLIRLTDSAVTTSTLLQKTTAIVKVIVLGSNTNTVHLQWSIVWGTRYSSNNNNNNNGDKCSCPPYPSIGGYKAISVLSFLMSIGLIGVVGFGTYILFFKKASYSTMSQTVLQNWW